VTRAELERRATALRGKVALLLPLLRSRLSPLRLEAGR
jgi:hypothetical protein